MIPSVLVPLDGSELSREVLTCVLPLVSPGVQVELFRVVTLAESFWEGEPPPEHQLADARRDLVAAGAPLEARDAQVIAVVDEGDPASQVLERALRTRPALIAMATHGRSGPSRWLRGSVAERVLREAPAPLLLVNPRAVVPTAGGGPRFERILVPLDGSPRAAAVIPLVREVARACGASAVLLRVGAHAQRDSESARAELVGSLTEVEVELRAAGVGVQVRVGSGDPAAQILEVAEELDVSLVAMATHGRTGVARWLLGSVTEKVLRACPRPLLVQPARPRAAAAGVATWVTAATSSGS